MLRKPYNLMSARILVAANLNVGAWVHNQRTKRKNGVWSMDSGKPTGKTHGLYEAFFQVLVALTVVQASKTESS